MTAPRLRPLLPRSLFGRAILILMVPIVVLQLVVGAVLLRRHYERVTEQLARSVALELALAIDRVEVAAGADQAAEALAEIGPPLGLSLRLDGAGSIGADRRAVYDVSGRAATAMLRRVIAQPLSVDLVSDPRRPVVRIATEAGILTAAIPRDRLTVANPYQLLVLVTLAAILLSIIAVGFLRNQVKPIRQLAEAAEAFGKGRSVPFRPAGAEEVRRAGTAFLAMRARIERQIEQRTRMLSGVSHDLRTPLTRMRLTLALMEDSQETRDMAHDIGEMEAMLNAFLAFQRDEGQEEAEPVCPLALMRGLAEDHRRTGTALSLSESVEPEGTAETLVTLRPVAIRRAVANLLDNAARHGRRVCLSVRLGPRSLEIAVEDDGPGIDPADRAEALRPFTRLDPARNQDSGGGVGLGLAIAMDVARSHGGALTLEESPTLGGLRAVIRIPR